MFYNRSDLLQNMKKNNKKKKLILHGNLDENDNAQKALAAHRLIVQTFKSRFNANRKWTDRFADFMTEQFGNFWFFIFNFFWYLLWFIWNNGLIPGMPVIDPYPHNFLTMIVSLEAIFLSIIVLISQNRQSGIADLREEIDFNINVRAEKEITKILNMVDKIHDHLGLDNEDDQELNEMKLDTDLNDLESQITEQFTRKKR